MAITITGTGMYVPEMMASNEDFEKLVDTTDEWIVTRTGIKTRHIANGELTYQIGANAAKQALDEAGIQASDVDMIIGTTVTADCITPSMACQIGYELGIEDAVCFDINAACAAYVYALDMAKNYLETGIYKNILIVSSEMISRITDYKDRATCVLFGDGAGATVVSKGEGIFASYIKCKPKGAYKIYAKQPEPENPFKTKQSDWGIKEITEFNSGYIFMDGNEVYKFATTIMPQSVKAASERAGITIEELDYIIPHQANYRIVQSAIKRLKLPEEKFIIGIEKYGNISSACIPAALHRLKKSGKLKRGDKICLVGFGAGLVYGSVVFEW